MALQSTMATERLEQAASRVAALAKKTERAIAAYDGEPTAPKLSRRDPRRLPLNALLECRASLDLVAKPMADRLDELLAAYTTD